ncbi:MAG: protein kinase, partial [Polyangiaceae bacterium]
MRTGRFKTLGVIGSPAYMAPEQRRGEQDLDRRADIYSLGIVFFEMLTGRLPFVAATEPELYRLHNEATLPSVRSLRPELPTSLDEILARACAKDRRNRFSTCEELDAALAQGGLPIMRSVPPTVMATQGLPSVPPAPPTPYGSSPPPHAYGSTPPPHAYGSTPPPANPYRSAPPGPPPAHPYGSAPPAPAAAPAMKVWKIVALSGGAVLAVAGIGLGWAISTGVFDDPEPALVDPPRARDAGAPLPQAQPVRVDAGPPAPLPKIPLPANPPAKKR